MEDNTQESFPPLKVGPIRGRARLFQRCGIITDETQTQCGLVTEDGDRYRLFFGEQTDEESKMQLGAFSLDGVAVEVVIEGYSKYATDSLGEVYFDERAIFVEKISRAS